MSSKDPFEEGFTAMEMPEGLLRLFMSMGRPSSEQEAVEIMRRSKEPLEELCNTILAHQGDLEGVNTALRTTFSDPKFVVETLSQEPSSLSFFPTIYSALSGSLSDYVDAYLRLGSEFNVYVDGNLDFPQGRRLRGDREADPPLIEPGYGQAATKAREILTASTHLYIHTKTSLPQFLKGLRKSFEQYEHYLRRRFIKEEGNDQKDQEMMRELIRRMQGDENELLAKYVKVKLVDSNPVLTDVLLGLADTVPQHNERISRSGKQNKEGRVSRYALDEAAEKLAAVSDPMLMGYIREPQRFFAHVGRMLEQYYRVLRQLDPAHRAILALPHHRLIVADPAQLREALQGDGLKVEREIERIKGADLDGIVQDPDEYVPDNRRETDHFRLREKLFDLFVDGMNELSGINEPDDRVDRARGIMGEAVGIRYDISQVLLTQKARRLRTDKGRDNEYYVGRQQGYGQFYFERKPTPDVSVDDVIGASFDTAKGHLREIIETGSLARVMSLSAPGGKVRSNILLIGPYGCGKTELARAICAGERVIGASVSVANTLTAYMHESVGNVKRVYDQAMELRSDARELKPVVLVLDEFDGWFAGSGRGTYTDTDMAQIENVFLEVLDGMEDYNGIITMAMTNNPLAVPKGIMRRFRYVDIVGQLTREERVQMLGMYLGRRLPLREDVPSHYGKWAERLDNAPGDVVRKVVDEVHFVLVPHFIAQYPRDAARMEKVLYNRENRQGTLSKSDIDYVKESLQKRGYVVTPDHVDTSLDNLLRQPPIRMQIDAARRVYADAHAILDEISSSGPGFGLRRRSGLFDRDR